MSEVTEEMIEAGAKTVWSQGTRGLFERKQHVSNILDAALAASPTRATTPTASELVEALRMISAEAKASNEPVGRSVFKALSTCAEIADLALSNIGEA